EHNPPALFQLLLLSHTTRQPDPLLRKDETAGVLDRRLDRSERIQARAVSTSVDTAAAAAAAAMAHPSGGAAQAVHDVGLDVTPTAATLEQQLQQQQQSHATTTAAAVASDGPSLAASSSVGAAAAPVSTAVAAAVTLQQQQQQPPPRLPPPPAALPPVPMDSSNNNGSAAAAAPASSTLPAGDPQQLYSPSGRKRKQRTSGVWKYFEQFPPVAPKGRNVRCTVLVEVPGDPSLGLPQRTVRCGATYTHVESRPGNGGSGTSGMLHHLFKKHPLIHAEIIR
ncbi:unnamed protein product, partial [Ectocarpus sp. 12 AP-2014]